MMQVLKAEFLKLSTVRSTYFITLIAFAIVVLFGGYGNGYKVDAPQLHNSDFLAAESAHAIMFVGIILALVGLLLLAHEYRYNTILYTLTSSRSRVKSLLAKLIAVTVYSLIVTTLITFFSPLVTIIGVHLAGKHMVAQSFPVWHILWQCLLVGWGYAVYAFIFIAIIRSQVGSIVSFLLVPLIGENIIMSIFKNSGKYLPFNSLQSIVNSNLPRADISSTVSTAHNVTVTCIYIVVGLAVSFVLFVKRDAS